MYPEAVEHRVQELKVSGQADWAAGIKDAFQRDGWNGALREDLRRFSLLEGSPYLLIRYGQASWLTMLGEKEKAFAALERSLEADERPSLVALKVDPRFDPLRDDPRFKDLLRRIGFPE
jgi:hypothetical protein